MSKQSISTLDQNDDGTLDVELTNGETIERVPFNLVRCAIGEADTEHLIGSEDGQPTGAFNLLDSEVSDFREYSEA